jgi:hypothetical protein
MASFKQGAKSLSDAVIFRSVVTEDMQVMSILFDNLEASLADDTFSADAGVQTRSVSIYIPIAENETETHLRVQIRGGAVRETNDVKELVLVQSGNTTTLIEPRINDVAYHKEVETTLPPNNDYFLTLFLLIQRNIRNQNSIGSLSVYSVDIAIDK